MHDTCSWTSQHRSALWADQIMGTSGESHASMAAKERKGVLGTDRELQAGAGRAGERTLGQRKDVLPATDELLCLHYDWCVGGPHTL